MRTARPLAAIALATVLAAVTGLSGCGADDDGVARDADPSTSPGTGSTDTTTTDGSAGTDASPSATAWPEFAAEDYTYRLEVLCYCPQVGQVRVTVVDGEVTGARSVSGPAKGRPAPEFARLTINDIIAKANDPAVAEAEVTWPDGQDHPTSVAIDQIENAVDDEVTYTIRAVQVTP